MTIIPDIFGGGAFDKHHPEESVLVHKTTEGLRLYCMSTASALLRA